MAGDKKLMWLNPMLRISTNESPLHYRIKVLGSLLNVMARLVNEQGVLLADYATLNESKIILLAQHFHLSVSENELGGIQQRMGLNAKLPEQRFTFDSLNKQHDFNDHERASINQELRSSYLNLLDISTRPLKESSLC